MTINKGTLIGTEPHPAVDSAADFIVSLSQNELYYWQSIFASCAIEHNRLAEVCYHTIERLLNKDPVSDRYLLGLAWTIKERCHP
ncbi:hypothetical protein LCGC14_1084970 [marine sediment metagenome]|uniref:Uncharacterized protein n=1 Tax=marine sediment metagenome TaxID=412755 RepID=A0A0F9MIJ2_9ZZZZ